MRVKELIEQLSGLDPEMEVTLHRQGFHASPSYDSSKLIVEKGYLVCDADGFYSRSEGNGCFVEGTRANRVMNDGKKFLDLTSPTIYPAIHIKLSHY